MGYTTKICLQTTALENTQPVSIGNPSPAFLTPSLLPVLGMVAHPVGGISATTMRPRSRSRRSRREACLEVIQPGYKVWSAPDQLQGLNRHLWGLCFLPGKLGPAPLGYKLTRIQWGCMWMYIHSEKTSPEDVKE